MRAVFTALVVMGGLFSIGCNGPAEEEAVTWHKDINPMLESHCTRCHSDIGQGVGNFTDVETVRTLSGRMLARMDEGTMPPPVSDPNCRDYESSEFLSLPEEKKELFRTWTATGMQEGDPEDAPVLEIPEPTLTDADMFLQPPEPYVPTFADARNPANEYRCFVLEHGRDETFYVTGFEPIVDEPQLVHHVLLLLVSESDIPDDYDPAVGADCIDGRGPLGDIAGMVAGWAPGMQPVRFDDGRGVQVRPNDRLVVQTHLYRKGPEVDGLSDQSGWALRTTDEIDTQLIMAPLGYSDFKIPAGDPAYTYDGTESGEGPLSLPIAGRAHAIFPHMHVLGTGYKLSIEKPDGTEECVVEGKYDFNNQISYILKEPVSVPAGSKINWECTWDNSEDNPNQINETPKRVTYGDRTDEEMCFAFTLFSFGI